MVLVQHYESPLGGITYSSDGEALTGLWFDGQKYFGESILERGGVRVEADEREVPVLAQTRRWLDEYFSGRTPGFTPQLRLQGTPFRRAVWEILLTIPYGRTVTYGEMASRLALQRGERHMSAQAVGGAVGHNPVSLIVPCHRVTGSDGSLVGYAGGVDRKARLLEMEMKNVTKQYGSNTKFYD